MGLQDGGCWMVRVEDSVIRHRGVAARYLGPKVELHMEINEPKLQDPSARSRLPFSDAALASSTGACKVSIFWRGVSGFGLRGFGQGLGPIVYGE